MKKIVRLTENDLTKIVKRVINEMDSASPLKVTAIVEDDMMMEFTIIEGSEVDGYINLTLKDSKGNTLRVSSPTKGTYIGGPIYDNKTNKRVYRNSTFQNINQKNIMNIVDKYKIPFMMT
jgi:hypothetical protein